MFLFTPVETGVTVGKSSRATKPALCILMSAPWGSRAFAATTKDPSRRGPARSTGRRTEANRGHRASLRARSAVILPFPPAPQAVITTVLMRPASRRPRGGSRQGRPRDERWRRDADGSWGRRRSRSRPGRTTRRSAGTRLPSRFRRHTCARARRRSPRSHALKFAAVAGGGVLLEIQRRCISLKRAAAIAAVGESPFAIGEGPESGGERCGDYKIDHTPVDGQRTDVGKLAEVGNRGVDLLLGDSTNAERPGFTRSCQSRRS